MRHYVAGLKSMLLAHCNALATVLEKRVVHLPAWEEETRGKSGCREGHSRISSNEGGGEGRIGGDAVQRQGGRAGVCGAEQANRGMALAGDRDSEMMASQRATSDLARAEGGGGEGVHWNSCIMPMMGDKASLLVNQNHHHAAALRRA